MALLKRDDIVHVAECSETIELHSSLAQNRRWKLAYPQSC